MVSLRLIFAVALTGMLTGCNLLNPGTVTEDKTLYPLHHAIEKYIELKAAAPDEAQQAVAGEVGGHTIVEDGEQGHLTTSLPEDPTASSEQPQHGEESADHEGSSNSVSHAPTAHETAETDSQADGHGADPHQPGSIELPVAVVAVVDSHYLKQATEEDEEVGGVLIEAAQRRERVVRREIHKSLVENTLIQALPQDAENELLAREFIIANNSEALSKSLCTVIGKSLGTEIIICVLIDMEGHEVNVAAQASSTGELIYQDALKDWAPAVNAVEQDETE